MLLVVLSSAGNVIFIGFACVSISCTDFVIVFLNWVFACSIVWALSSEKLSKFLSQTPSNTFQMGSFTPACLSVCMDDWLCFAFHSFCLFLFSFLTPSRPAPGVWTSGDLRAGPASASALSTSTRSIM